jgi:hypothetical protein
LVVVLLPISVLAALLLVAVPATRRAFALLTLLVAFVACLAIPLAFLSGRNLEGRLPPSPLISRHVQLAHQLLPLAAVFGVVLAVFVGVDLLRRADTGHLNELEERFVPSSGSRSASVNGGRFRAAYRISATLVVVLAILTGVQVYRVGDAGAKASWTGRLSPPASATGQSKP